MENKHYDYGIINGGTIKLFNNSIMDIYPLHDEGLEDVNVELCDNGVFKIDAKKIEYDFYDRSYGSRIFEEDWERTPHPKCIKEVKRHFWSKNKERYVNCGWVRTTEITPMQCILSNYKVEVIESEKETGLWLICEDGDFLEEQWLQTSKPKHVEGRTDKFDFNKKHYEEDVDFFNNLHIDTDINMKNGDCINVTLRQIQNA